MSGSSSEPQLQTESRLGSFVLPRRPCRAERFDFDAERFDFATGAPPAAAARLLHPPRATLRTALVVGVVGASGVRGSATAPAGVGSGEPGDGGPDDDLDSLHTPGDGGVGEGIPERASRGEEDAAFYRHGERPETQRERPTRKL